LGKQFFYSSLYGWGIPFIVVVVGQILQHSDVPDDIIKPGLPSKLYCWFNRKLSDIFLSFTCINKCLNFTFSLPDKHRRPLIAYLYGPMIVMIIANVFMFVWAAFSFYQRSVESSEVTKVSRKKQRYYWLPQFNQELHLRLPTNR
jgi:hypothetical protein